MICIATSILKIHDDHVYVIWATLFGFGRDKKINFRFCFSCSFIRRRCHVFFFFGVCVCLFSTVNCVALLVPIVTYRCQCVSFLWCDSIYFFDKYYLMRYQNISPFKTEWSEIIMNRNRTKPNRLFYFGSVNGFFISVNPSPSCCSASLSPSHFF